MFLDEVSEMPTQMQAKLLAVLDDKTIRRIGDDTWIKLDVRFIAASNRPLDELKGGGAMRADLYFRLAMNSLFIPPLRARPEDISCLACSMLDEFNAMNDSHMSLSTELIEALMKLRLDGNTRELKSIVWEIASTVDENTDVITLPMLTQGMRTRLTGGPAAPTRLSPTGPVAPGDKAERLYQLSMQYDGDVYSIARILGIHRTTVIRRLRRFGIPYARRYQGPSRK